MQTQVFIAPKGFERELGAELASAPGVTESRERLFIAPTRDAQPAWAQNSWLNPQRIEIESIADGARKLKALAPYWALHSTTHHRRAQLIQEQLPKVKRPPLDFRAALPEKPLGSWTLLDEKTILAATSCTSLFPDGEVAFNEDKTAPSRAYLKLWELFTIDGVAPKAGERCLDLGASPGGWTWVLANSGCLVTAIDRAALDPRVASRAGVSTVVRNAFTLKPNEIEPVDWLFSDLICYPNDLFLLVTKWLESGRCRNFVCTLKFRGETDHATAKLFAAIPGSHLRHLSVNKHELTWWLVRS